MNAESETDAIRRMLTEGSITSREAEAMIEAAHARYGQHPPAPWNPPPMRTAPQETGPDALKRVKLLYGKSLNDDDVAGVAALETEYPRWHIWPHVNFSYPDNEVYYARRNNTQMNLLTASGLPAIREAIDAWIGENRYPWDRP